MNVVDLVIFVILIVGGWNGYRTGLVRQVTHVFGIVIAYVLAVWLRPYIVPVIEPMLKKIHWSQPLHSPFHFLLGNLSGMVAFAAVFVVAFVGLRLVGGLVEALFHLPVLSTLNRLAGLVAGLILALVLIYVAVLVVQYINAPGLQAALGNSAVVQWFNTVQAPVA